MPGRGLGVSGVRAAAPTAPEINPRDTRTYKVGLGGVFKLLFFIIFQIYFSKYIICREKRISMFFPLPGSPKVPPRPFTNS